MLKRTHPETVIIAICNSSTLLLILLLPRQTTESQTEQERQGRLASGILAQGISHQPPDFLLYCYYYYCASYFPEGACCRPLSQLPAVTTRRRAKPTTSNRHFFLGKISEKTLNLLPPNFVCGKRGALRSPATESVSSSAVADTESLLSLNPASPRQTCRQEVGGRVVVPSGNCWAYHFSCRGKAVSPVLIFPLKLAEKKRAI